MAEIIDYEFDDTEFTTANEPEKQEAKSRASPSKKRKGRGFERGELRSV